MKVNKDDSLLKRKFKSELIRLKVKSHNLSYNLKLLHSLLFIL